MGTRESTIEIRRHALPIHLTGAAVLMVCLICRADRAISADLEPMTRGAPPSPKIVNGVSSHGFPPVGALLHLDDDDRLVTSCTATLIGCTTVLAAAHCFCGADLTAAECEVTGTAEATRLRTVFALQHAGFFRLKWVLLNPDYKFGSKADIAIIGLDRPVERIPPSRINGVGRPPSGTEGTIVGYGLDGGGITGIKNAGTVQLGDCGGTVPSATHLCWSFSEPVGPPGEDSNTCSGDSGGPLFLWPPQSDAVLAGVTSGRASASCLPPVQAFDTDVFVYRDWIQFMAGSDLGQTCGQPPFLGDAATKILFASDELSEEDPDVMYEISVPPGTAELRVALNGQDEVLGPPDIPNDFELYVRRGAAPTLDQFDCKSALASTYEYCSFPNPPAETWYVAAALFEGAGSFQVTVTMLGQAPTASVTPSATTTPALAATATETVALTPTRTKTPTTVPTSTRPPAPTATLPAIPCYGDCNNDARVTIDELVTAVSIALGTRQVSSCPAADRDGNRRVTIDELIASVAAALNGCSGAASKSTPAP